MLWFNKTKQEPFFPLASSFLPNSFFLVFILPRSPFPFYPFSVLLISYYFFNPSILFFIHSFFLLFISSFIFSFSFHHCFPSFAPYSILFFLSFSYFPSFLFFFRFAFFPCIIPSSLFFLSFVLLSTFPSSFPRSSLFFSSLRSFH